MYGQPSRGRGTSSLADSPPKLFDSNIIVCVVRILLIIMFFDSITRRMAPANGIAAGNVIPTSASRVPMLCIYVRSGLDAIRGGLVVQVHT